jgi:hypothetical protein
VKTTAGDKRFGLVDIWQTAGEKFKSRKKGIAWNVIILIIHESSFKYLGIKNKAQSHARSVFER